MSFIINGMSKEHSGSLIKPENWLKLNQKFWEILNRSSWVKLETASQIGAVSVESNLIPESNLILKY